MQHVPIKQYSAAGIACPHKAGPAICRAAGMVLFLFFFTGTIYKSHAQYHFRFDNITSEQGIADRYINAITQDEKGFIWIGSEDGLTRFDGYAAVVYRHDNNTLHSLADNEIYALCTDNDSGLWIGTRNGLSRYNSRTDRFENFYHDEKDTSSLAGNEIFGLAKDASGNIWVAIYGGGVAVAEKINGGNKPLKQRYRFRHYKHDKRDSNSLSANQVFAISFDKKNNAWIATNNGLTIYDIARKKFTRLYHNPADPHTIAQNSIYKIFPGHDGSMWVYGYNMLDKIIPATADYTAFSITHYLPLINTANLQQDWSINEFIIDKTNNGWLATNDQGLIKISLAADGSVQHAENFSKQPLMPSSLAGSIPYCLFEDKSGVLWIGTEKGISTYVPGKNRFNAVSFPIPVPALTVLALAVDNKDRIWLGHSSDTLLVIDKKNNALKKIRLSIPGQAPAGQVNTLFKSKKGDMYAGTMDQGIFMFPATAEAGKGPIHISQEAFPQLLSNNIYAMEEDSKGLIWIGSYKGLCTYDPVNNTIRQVLVHPQAQSASAYLIRALCFDKDNLLWCGTDEGLYVLADGRVQQVFKNKKGISSSINDNRISCILKDHSNNIWIGTRAGLNLYNRQDNSFRHFTGIKDFPQEAIKILKEDSYGNMWMGTNHGLVKYDLTAARVYHYDMADGLCAEEFQRNSMATDAAGFFYFGTANGIVSFYPQQITPNDFIPPIVITRINIMNRDIYELGDSALINTYKTENKLRLAYNQNFFSFEFAALNYINPQANTYLYQLEGVDRQWVQAGNQRFAGYTDIRPGHYVFKVKAANNDGVWNKVPATIDIFITPPWWKTWWFYMLCALAICSGIYVLYRLRLNQVIKLYKLRSSIAQDLHDDVGSALSSIAMLSSIAGNKKTDMQMKPEQALSRIGQTSKKMIDLMDDIVWSVNPDNDRFTDMLVRMREYAVEMLETRNIDFDFRVGEDIRDLKLPMKMRKDYFLIFKEAIHNIAKYAQASLVSISLKRQHNMIYTSIADNGKGFDLNATHSGNGLKNMQQRAVALKGKLDIATSNKCTIISLHITVT